MKRIIAAILPALVLLTIGCERIKTVYGLNKDDPTALVTPPAPVYAVSIIPAAQGSISDYFSLAGDVSASSSVDTYSDAAGKVASLYVSVGSWVSRGDAIAEIDPSRPGMEFVTSIVRAPVSGTVVMLPAQVGMTISQAVPIARIAAGTGLDIRLHVAERFISRVRLNQPCEITLDAWPGESFNGRIREISPTIDPTSRTMEIRVVVDNAGSRLKSGMFAKVKIITDQKQNVVKIPSNAVVRRFGEEYVFVAVPNPEKEDEYIAVKKDIVPGILIDSVLEVERGLNAGDEVIIKGQALLTDGSTINVVQRESPLP